MDTITVSKKNLLNTLRSNRTEHRQLFVKAQKVYRQKMIEELDRALQEARDGGKIRRAFALPVPEDHTEDFSTAIAMLKWHQDDSVDLSQREFQTYVENKWGWQASFAANTSSYLVSE